MKSSMNKVAILNKGKNYFKLFSMTRIFEFFFLSRPIIGTGQISTIGSMDSEGSNVKRESILGMAVTGVRNFLVVRILIDRLDLIDLFI